MPIFRRPCIDCGRLTEGKTRCQLCKTARMRADSQNRDKTLRAKYGAGYQTAARKIRENATVCWICGLPARIGDPWQADHVDPEDPTNLLPAHRSCNISRSNRARTSGTG